MAEAVYAAFRAYRTAFAAITEGARTRFEAADWAGVQTAGSERLDTYNAHVGELVARDELADALTPGTWPQIKAAYVDLIDDTVDADLAETFFNSVYRKHARAGGTDPTEMFLHPSEARVFQRSADECAHSAAVIHNESVKCHSIPPPTW